MNINKVTFDGIPNLRRPRYMHDLSHHIQTSAPIGKLFPIEAMEVLPGDTWINNTGYMCRLASTFIRPIMDNVYLDIDAFFIPYRLTQDNFEDIFGVAEPSEYLSDSRAEFATFSTAQTCTAGSVADYLGITPGSVPLGCRLAEIRAFALVWNEWFRNQNVDAETYVNKSETPSTAEVLNGNAWSATNYTGLLPPVTRYKDYFSSALPNAQKAAKGVMMPAEVHAADQVYTVLNDDPMVLMTVGGSAPVSNFPLYAGNVVSDPATGVQRNLDIDINDSASGNDFVNVNPANLYAQIDVNALRTYTALQKYVERDGLYGSRYREYLRSAYGVVSPDSRLQVPEFLAGSHNRLNVTQVAATSDTSSADYDVGSLAGMSHSFGSGTRFSKTFTEHGIILYVGCIRYKHIYSQGIPRMFGRTKREHVYDNLFQNLGLQQIFKSEIYSVGATNMREEYDLYSGTYTDPALGYCMPFDEYRHLPNRVTSGMRPSGTGANYGDVWSLADRFSSAPSLLDVVHESPDSIQRVISGEVGADPFIIDFDFGIRCAREVPLYAIPGYVDHH